MIASIRTHDNPKAGGDIYVTEASGAEYFIQIRCVQDVQMLLSGIDDILAKLEVQAQSELAMLKAMQP